MKRIIVSGVAILLAAVMLFGCSAYGNPSKYLEMPEKGKVTISTADVNKEVDEEIEDLLESDRKEYYTELTDADATVQMGDKAAIFYTGTPKDESLELTEEELSGMTNAKGDNPTPHDLIIGSNEFIGAYESDDETKANAGFEEQIIGHKKGDKFTITVTFPDSYSSNTKLEGQVVNFEIEIKTISRNVIDDAKTATVEYTFVNPYEDEEAPETDAPETETPATGESEVVGNPDEADTDGETDGDTTTTGETVTTDMKAKFEELFKKGEFEIDYTKLAEEEGVFNTLFKIAEQAELFKGKTKFYETTATLKIADDEDDEKFADFKGQEITVNFKVTEVTSVPELTDDYVKEETEGEYETVAAYKESLFDSIARNDAYEAISAAARVTEYPKKELKESYKSYVDNLVYSHLYSVNKDKPNVSDYTPEELKKILTDEVYKDIYAKALESAKKAVKDRLVLEYLIDYYKVTLSNKEYKEKLNEYYEANKTLYAYYYGIDSASTLERYFGKDNLKTQFLSEKLNDQILDYVTVAD